MKKNLYENKEGDKYVLCEKCYVQGKFASFLKKVSENSFGECHYCNHISHPNTPKEYDNNMKHTPKIVEDTVEITFVPKYQSKHTPPKSRLKSFIGGLVIGGLVGSLITVALYGGWVLSLLEETSNDSKLDHTFILNEIIR